jgi:hypothetical protein
MSVEALWSLEFFSSQNIEGTGVAVLETNRVLGGDAQYTYVGEYSVENNSFTARILISLYGNNPYSAFGYRRDPFWLIVSGQHGNQEFEARGYIEGEPEKTIRIYLTRRAELP